MSNFSANNRILGEYNNICIRVIDTVTGKVVQEHTCHNCATNSMLTGIARYLVGDGTFNQGYSMLSQYVPKYISLGTMGLINQEQEPDGLPAGIGVTIPDISSDPEYAALVEAMNEAKEAMDEAYEALQNIGCCDVCESCTYYQSCPGKAEHDELKAEYDIAKQEYEDALNAVMTYSEDTRFAEYMAQRPGYGADGYDINSNNNRRWFGLGPVYKDRPDTDKTVNCELISASFPRAEISFRDVVPETESELPKTIDVVFSAMISTGALKQFREPGKDYIFITEAGLWSKPDWPKDADISDDSYSWNDDSRDYDSGDNGLLAAYRIVPPNRDNWDMTIESNRQILKQNIIRVGINQIVQVVWKIQLGSIDQLSGYSSLGN